MKACDILLAKWKGINFLETLHKELKDFQLSLQQKDELAYRELATALEHIKHAQNALISIEEE